MYGLIPRVHASPADQIIAAVFLTKTKNPVLSSTRGPMQDHLFGIKRNASHSPQRPHRHIDKHLVGGKVERFRRQQPAKTRPSSLLFSHRAHVEGLAEDVGRRSPWEGYFIFTYLPAGSEETPAS